MRIMSFNTQHCMDYITKEIDFDLFAGVILSSGADIIGLNEMRGKGVSSDYTAQVDILSEKTGLEGYFAKAIDVNGVDPYGNGLLSRFPILKAETIPVPDPKEPMPGGKWYETRCLLKAVIDAPGGPLTVCVIHFGLNPDEQENAVQTVLSAITEERCVLMGDFNVLPDDPVLIPIRERMFDTAELFAEPKLSFPSDKPDRKIDYLFVSKDMKVLAADIPAIVASDHRPYTAEVE
ncbi:MAG: endonuclease/exonuclease/phosphatase family protein [Oscillospiraceae bacterium]|nr:endonuclease/exonuclease/phosphatase family protein [Oscillospiraceae bacterium]